MCVRARPTLSRAGWQPDLYRHTLMPTLHHLQVFRNSYEVHRPDMEGWLVARLMAPSSRAKRGLLTLSLPTAPMPYISFLILSSISIVATRGTSFLPLPPPLPLPLRHAAGRQKHKTLPPIVVGHDTHHTREHSELSVMTLTSATNSHLLREDCRIARPKGQSKWRTLDKRNQQNCFPLPERNDPPHLGD